METKKLVEASVVSAAYAALTIAIAPLSYGAVQLRFGEALTVLPFFMPHTAWGLAVGCALANLIGGYGLADIVFGSLATLAAGLVTARLRRRALAPLPPVIFNAVIVGLVITYMTAGGSESFEAAAVFNMLTVGAGELAACYALGLPLLYLLPRIPYFKKAASYKLKERMSDDEG